MPKFTGAVMKKINKCRCARIFGCAKTTLQAIAYPGGLKSPGRAVIPSAPVSPPLVADACLRAGLSVCIVV